MFYYRDVITIAKLKSWAPCGDSAAILTNRIKPISVTRKIQTMPEGSFNIEDFGVRSRGT